MVRFVNRPFRVGRRRRVELPEPGRNGVRGELDEDPISRHAGDAVARGGVGGRGHEALFALHDPAARHEFARVARTHGEQVAPSVRQAHLVPAIGPRRAAPETRRLVDGVRRMSYP